MAQYNPRSVQLDDPGESNRDKVTNVFKMSARVYRYEGLAGLYKGTMPSALGGILYLLLRWGAYNAHIEYADIIRLRYDIPEPFRVPFVVAVYSLQTILFAVVALPISVIYIRAVTTPYRLGWFDPVRSLRVLFTPAELRRPWIIFATPGLVTINVIQAIIKAHVLQGITLIASQPWPKEELLWRIPVVVLLGVISLINIPVLDVIKAKLSVQQSDSESSPAVPKEVSVEEYSAVDVVSFRQEPYSSLIDCVKKIGSEEGWTTLLRLWWAHLIASLVVIYNGIPPGRIPAPPL